MTVKPMKMLEAPGWSQRSFRRRWLALVCALFMLATILAVAFHSHQGSERHAIHSSCDFCEVAQAAGLASGAVQVAAGISILSAAIYALLSCPPNCRPLLARRPFTHGKRAPPLV